MSHVLFLEVEYFALALPSNGIHSTDPTLQPQDSLQCGFLCEVCKVLVGERLKAVENFSCQLGQDKKHLVA